MSESLSTQPGQTNINTALLTLAVDEGDWQPIHTGVERKLLARDGGEESYLLRLSAGASIPAHAHPADEETLVVEGDFCIGELRLKTGDFHFAAATSTHPVLRSDQGALLFVRYAQPNVSGQ